jgi:hypothetical protein
MTGGTAQSLMAYLAEVCSQAAADDEMPGIT